MAHGKRSKLLPGARVLLPLSRDERYRRTLAQPTSAQPRLIVDNSSNSIGTRSLTRECTLIYINTELIFRQLLQSQNPVSHHESHIFLARRAQTHRTHRNLPLQNRLKVLLPLGSEHFEQPLPRLRNSKANIHHEEDNSEDEKASFFDGEGSETYCLERVRVRGEVDFEAFDGPVRHGVDAVGGGAESLKKRVES